MIRELEEKDIAECVKLIRESFGTVAEEFGFTVQNAPGFTAFATTEEKMKERLLVERRPMYIYCEEDRIVGFYFLELQDENACELNTLCVSPAYRHRGIGEELLQHAFERVKELNCNKIRIGIVEENQVLRKWYESFGFIHLWAHKSERFPFTCGFMEKEL